MNTNLYIINKFYDTSDLIIHISNPPESLNSCCSYYNYLEFDTGDILELDYSKIGLNKPRLRSKTGQLTLSLDYVSDKTPFKIVDNLQLKHIKLIELKYLTPLEFFDIKYK
jgi:hypothetical protein